MPVVQVALPVPLARTFDYRLDSAMGCPVVGARVSVPFGKRNAIGIVVGISETCTFPLEQLKVIDAVLDGDSLFPPSLWRILCWATEYYHYPIGEVLFHALPILLRQGSLRNPPLVAMVCHRTGPRHAARKLKTRAEATTSPCGVITKAGLSPSS